MPCLHSGIEHSGNFIKNLLYSNKMVEAKRPKSKRRYEKERSNSRMKSQNDQKEETKIKDRPFKVSRADPDVSNV